MPEPLTLAGCDLRDFPFLPIDIARLFGSEFHALADDSEWRAGITLWLKSFHQVPAASLPDDDTALARLAELGRDVKTWRKLRERALHGWVKCSDGRLYHPVVAEKVHEAWKGKQSQRARTCKARISAFLTRLSKAADDIEFAHVETLVTGALSELSQHLSQAEFQSVEKSVTDSVAETKRKREGQGEGKGKPRSVPNGTGGPPPAMSADEMTKLEIWRAGKSVLQQSGMPKDQCGSFLGKLIKDYDNAIVLEAVRAAVVEQPADAAEYLKACCQRLRGERKAPNRQEALEANNRAVAERLAAELEGAAQ
nr:DUF1376 domain-containing protein [Cupriavidus taiwanensis]